MNRLILRVGMVLSVVIALPGSASACMWDYDTLKQERARFPDTLEIITGKFLRHSKEFYEWRIQDRLKRIAAEPKNPALYDDLAVAYEKTGQNPKAIQTMLKVEAFAPGRYETYSNLGAFYFLGGDLKKGLEYVDKALAINPDAHFGREKYQKYLTEYVIGKKEVEAKPGYKETAELHTRGLNSFSAYLAKSFGVYNLNKEQTQAAVKGVLGMMRFAYYDSSILLSALGDLLRCAYEPANDAKMLAARAYLKAGNSMRATEALSLQTVGDGSMKEKTLQMVEAEFKLELDDANRWYDELRSKEISWIRDGLNPEEEFDKLYAEEPQVPGEIGASDEYPGDPKERAIQRAYERAIIIGSIILGLIVALMAFFVIRRIRR